ncbi:hypothetical protein [Streptomyces sp. NPDC002564]|uniref:hypothetical protein n=1 Tax=Streptomyces sp. NPDC002564 TaxID=3364649 RepID=UPI0036B0CDD0
MTGQACVGDEVREGASTALVTDIRNGVVWLRSPGREEWPADDGRALRVTRTREQRIAAGDVSI